MPQASDALREEWDHSEIVAILYLLEQGYALDAGWCWVVHGAWEPTEKEYRAVQYLVDEWDFGGFVQHAILPLRYFPGTTMFQLLKSVIDHG